MKTGLTCMAVSALLAALAVAALNAPGARAGSGVKPFQDRLPQAEAPAVPVRIAALPREIRDVGPTGEARGPRLDRGGNPCADAVWPYLPRECASPSAWTGRAPRTVTIERRVGETRSVLERVPLVAIAGR